MRLRSTVEALFTTRVDTGHCLHTPEFSRGHEQRELYAVVCWPEEPLMLNKIKSTARNFTESQDTRWENWKHRTLK
jgi:hypothetical protein